jgi:hypothetical protein
MRRIRPHLTYANVMATIAVFLVLTGGTAVALNGTNTVQSDDLGPGAQVKAPDVADNAVNSADVVNESLTGTDIKNRSGVDTCKPPLTIKFGPICAGSDGVARTWVGALGFCANLGLRLPTNSEAERLAIKYNVPGVGPEDTLDRFWTDDTTYVPNGVDVAGMMLEDADLDLGYDFVNEQHKAVCVTDPSA